MTTLAPSSPANIVRNPISLFLYTTYCELMKLMRIPAYVIPVLFFPTMFFAMFGLPNINNTIQGASAGAYILASYSCYGLMSVGLFSFGISIASERGLGWNKLLRVTPMNPVIYFSAKIVVALIIGVVTIAILFAFGILTAHLESKTGTLIVIGALDLVGMLPFIALGLFLGYSTGPNSAAGIANLIFLPLSFASGLFIPVQFLPDIIQKIAKYLPSYHVAQLEWSYLNAGDGNSYFFHFLWIAGYTVVFAALAVIAYRRDENKNYG